MSSALVGRFFTREPQRDVKCKQIGKRTMGYLKMHTWFWCLRRKHRSEADKGAWILGCLGWLGLAQGCSSRGFSLSRPFKLCDESQR